MGRRYSLQLFDSVTCFPSHSRPSTEQSSWSSSESEWPRPLTSPSTGADDPEHTGNKNRLVYCVIRSIYTIFYLFLVSVCISYKVLLPPYIASSSHLLILKPRRGSGQGDGPRRPENNGRRIAIRRSEIDRDVNFAKKLWALLKWTRSPSI